MYRACHPTVRVIPSGACHFAESTVSLMTVGTLPVTGGRS